MSDDIVEKKGGEFKFIWALKSKDKGLVVFAGARSLEEKKFGWVGNAYYLQKQSEKGTVFQKLSVAKDTGKQYKELGEDKFPEAPKNQSSSALPQGESLKSKMKNSNGSNEIPGCSVTFASNDSYSNGCDGRVKRTTFQHYGTGKGVSNASSTAGDGMSNLEQWGKDTFNESSQINDAVSQIKGTGIQ